MTGGGIRSPPLQHLGIDVDNAVFGLFDELLCLSYRAAEEFRNCEIVILPDPFVLRSYAWRCIGVFSFREPFLY